MKKLLLVLSLILACASGFAQTPEKISYQALVRNTENTILANQNVGLQISVLEGSASGTAVYVETQKPNTNANGLISIEIGAGTVESGSLSAIDWSNANFFIKTEIDITGGSNYTITGTSQLLSVPYALHAKTAESISGVLTETDPVYASSAASNITATDVNKLGNLSGTNTGDQDISGIAANASAIATLETEQDSQDAAIALNTTKTTNATHTGDVTGDTVLTIADDAVTTAKIAGEAVTVAKIGTAGETDANKALTTDATGKAQWSPMKAHDYGDIKYGIQNDNHNGWVLLDGTAITSLTPTQQNVASTLGFTTNLPDARNKYLTYAPSETNSFGSNAVTIDRRNLPNITLSGITNSSGSHNHRYGDYHYVDTGLDPNYATGAGDDGGQRTNTNRTTGTAGAHSHSFTTESINGGLSQTALENRPSSFNTRIFIYLGE